MRGTIHIVVALRFWARNARIYRIFIIINTRTHITRSKKYHPRQSFAYHIVHFVQRRRALRKRSHLRFKKVIYIIIYYYTII